MRLPLLTAVLLSIFVVASFAPADVVTPTPAAQEPPVAVPKPPAEPVFTHIPAGALGFIAINNIQAFAGKLDEYLNQIGIAEMIPPIAQAGSLGTLQGMLALGEGFNPNGGFAAVMLDPEAFGFDITSFMPMAGAPPATAPPAVPAVPVVLIIPGASAAEIFAQTQTATDEKYATVMLPPGPMLAANKGGYLLLSPSEPALDAALAAETTLTSSLAAKEVEILAASDLSVYINMEVAGPIYMKVLEMVESQFAPPASGSADAEGGPTTAPAAPVMAGPFGPMEAMMSMYIPMYRELISGLRSNVVALRMEPTGLVIDQLVSFDPQSSFGKMTSCYAGGAPAKLDRLPDLPYVLAASSAMATGPGRQESIDLSIEMMDKFLVGLNVLEETKTKIRQIARGLYEEVTGMQMVIGGAPEGSGLLGAACVLQCRDAEKVKAMLAEEAEIVQEVVTALSGSDVADVSFKYTPSVAAIQEAQVDEILISHPEIAEMDEEELDELTRAFGEPRIRALVAAADAKTVVVTFGGAQAFMAETLKAWKAGGPIQARPATAEVMKFLPPNSYSVVLLNIGNLTDVILSGAQVMAADESLPPIKIDCPIPIAIGCAVYGSSSHTVVYIPNELVSKTIGMVRGLFMPPMMGPEGGTVPGYDGDF